MSFKIEPLSGRQIKNNTTLIWEKNELQLLEYKSIQFILATNQKGDLQVTITGFNNTRTKNKILTEKTLNTNNAIYVFAINSDDVLQEEFDNFDIKVMANGTERTVFSVVAVYSNLIFLGKNLIDENEETESENEEVDEELTDYTFSGNTVTKCTQQGGVIEIPASYKIKDGKFYKGDDIAVTAIGNGILYEANNYTEIIIPDSVITFPVYGFHHELATTCKKIVSGNGFGKKTMESYPFGHTNYCDTIECGTGLTDMGETYVFGATSTVKTLKFATINPPKMTNAWWIGVLSNLQTIFVPEEGLDNWKTAIYWQDFAEKMVGY